MPSGDRTRTWFPEMIEVLRQEWKESLSWADVIQLCVSCTRQRKAIRFVRDIQPVTMVCKDCGGPMEMGAGRISVRSLLFALDKNGIVSTEVREGLDSSWRKYKVRHGLDAWGEPKAAKRSAGGGARRGSPCEH